MTEPREETAMTKPPSEDKEHVARAENPPPEGVCSQCRGSGEVEGGTACPRCAGSGENPDMGELQKKREFGM